MSTISVRLEDELAKEFKDFCNEMGFSTSAMLRGMIKKVIKEGKIEFSGSDKN